MTGKFEIPRDELEYDVYTSINGEEWNHQTTTTDPVFITYLNGLDDVLYWKTEPIGEPNP